MLKRSMMAFAVIVTSAVLALAQAPLDETQGGGKQAPIIMVEKVVPGQALPTAAGATAGQGEEGAETEVQEVMDVNLGQDGNVTLDFREAEIRNVLKVLAYKTGTNIIAGPEVEGVVSIQLKDVPWQKALDVILSTYGYSYEQKGEIILVTTVENLKKRREEAKLLADQEPIATETFLLNFGKAEDAVKSLEKMKTARGSINFDKRTNAVIVSDVSSNIQLMREVVKKLDTVTPQVLIEAKIVETTLNKDENMGIKWTISPGASGASRATTFPFTTDSRNRYMPGVAETGAITYGALNLTSLTAVLNMLQTRTDTNILSNPSIVTMDNQAAKIVVGSQYPVPEYTYNEQQAKMKVSGWSYMDIGIVFNVTPHVNNAGVVTLDIEPSVTESDGEVTVEGTSMPILSVKSAKTSVMISDGETLMIAGLIKDKKKDVRTKVPILGDIPILGWPFQHKNPSVVKTELVIFLTPHIITPKGAEAANKK